MLRSAMHRCILGVAALACAASLTATAGTSDSTRVCNVRACGVAQHRWRQHGGSSYFNLELTNLSGTLLHSAGLSRSVGHRSRRYTGPATRPRATAPLGTSSRCARVPQRPSCCGSSTPATSPPPAAAR